jgi:Tfp pilus assembly protein FimT
MFKNLQKNKYTSKPVRLHHSSGVTLIELIVVILIFMIITSITIFNYGKFRSSLSIQNLADDISLSVRRAQGFAIGVRGSQGGFTLGYGVHFTTNNKSTEYNGSNKSFIIFTNFGDDYHYDNSSDMCGSPKPGNECLEVLNISSADNIEAIFLNNETNPIPSTDSLDIVFKRPSPEPIFCRRGEGVGSCNIKGISNVKIKISTDADPSIYKIITIYNNGQISVSGNI